MADPMRYEMRQQSGSEKRRAWHVSNWTDTLVGHHRLEDVDHGVLGVFRGASKMLQCWDPAIHWFIFIPHPWRGLIIAWHCGKRRKHVRSQHARAANRVSCMGLLSAGANRRQAQHRLVGSSRGN